MKSLAECSKIEKGSLIRKEEQNKEISFRHEQYDLVCDVIKIDDCVFNKVEGERSCDYLFLFKKNRQEYNFLKNKPSIAYYVELKGVDLEGACEQLLNSIEKTKDEISGFDINAVIVSSREFMPQYDMNDYLIGVKRLIKKDIVFALTPHTIEL
jgi:hypothetical protein